MTILLVCILIFLATLAAALFGLYAHRTLPDHQKTDSARSIVGQVAGLIGLLLALVLGTLIGTSFAFFATQKAELETLSAQILELDQRWRNMGLRPNRRGRNLRRRRRGPTTPSGAMAPSTRLCHGREPACRLPRDQSLSIGP